MVIENDWRVSPVGGQGPEAEETQRKLTEEIKLDRESGENSYYSITNQPDKLAGEPSAWGATSDGEKLFILHPRAGYGSFSAVDILPGNPESYINSFDNASKLAPESPEMVRGLPRMKRSLESFASAALADGNIDIAVKCFERTGDMDKPEGWFESVQKKVEEMRNSNNPKDRENLVKAEWAIDKYKL